jgi:hypothetical protein
MIAIRGSDALMGLEPTQEGVPVAPGETSWITDHPEPEVGVIVPGSGEGAGEGVVELASMVRDALCELVDRQLMAGKCTLHAVMSRLSSVLDSEAVVVGEGCRGGGGDGVAASDDGTGGFEESPDQRVDVGFAVGEC